MTERYFLDDAPDGTWCLVPEDLRGAWDAWSVAVEEGGDDLLPPGIVVLGDVHPRLVIFERPEVLT